MKKTLALAVLAMLLLAAAPANATSDLEVIISPGSTATPVGTKIDVTVTVLNTGTTASGNLAVHIDVTDPKEESSVDPEDWVPELTKQLTSLEPGQSGTLSWTLNPIAGGEFALYAVALDNSGGTEPTVVAVSNGVPVVVSEERSINPDGVLPLLIGFPVLIGGLLVWRNKPRRKSAGPG